MPSTKPGYVRQYVSDKDVGALHPSSRFLVRRLVGCLGGRPVKTIVELGPGPGVATRALLDILPRDGRYVAVEKNPVFLEALGAIDDPRLERVGGDARELTAILDGKGVSTADVVVASIPFSFLTEAERTALVETVHSRLADDGDFVIFHQFSRLMAKRVRRSFPVVRVLFEPRNFFPCFLVHGRKKP